MLELQDFKEIKSSMGEAMTLEEHTESLLSINAPNKNNALPFSEPDIDEPSEKEDDDKEEAKYYKNYIQISYGNISVDVGSVNHSLDEIEKVVFEILSHIQQGTTRGSKDLQYCG